MERDIYEYLATLQTAPGVAHGQMFHYQTPTTDVVNWVTNRSTGGGLLDDCAALWADLGADGEAYLLLDPACLPIAAGGLNATPMDLARFAAMVAARGALDGRSVVDAGVIDTIAAGGSIDAFLAGPDAEGFLANGEWSYRAQWWVRHTPGTGSHRRTGHQRPMDLLRPPTATGGHQAQLTSRPPRPGHGPLRPQDHRRHR